MTQRHKALAISTKRRHVQARTNFNAPVGEVVRSPKLPGKPCMPRSGRTTVYIHLSDAQVEFLYDRYPDAHAVAEMIYRLIKEARKECL